MDTPRTADFKLLTAAMITGLMFQGSVETCLSMLWHKVLETDFPQITVIMITAPAVAPMFINADGGTGVAHVLILMEDIIPMLSIAKAMQ